MRRLRAAPLFLGVYDRSMRRTSWGVATAALLLLTSRGQNAAAAEPLPAGNGRDIAASKCIACHDAGRLVYPGYTREGWQKVIDRMTKLGATVSPEQDPLLSDYLARAFPERPPPAARIIPGTARASFKEWAVATPGAFPHDPLATADGAIWYTGQRASLLGRIDPGSGAIREYPTSIPDSGPHGLVADAAGNIWFTANYAGYIGKLDPATGVITVYRMPDERARDPHTAIFDQHGVLWFTVQGANFVGQLLPQSGTVRLVELPAAHSLPYGMVVSSRGVPFLPNSAPTASGASILTLWRYTSMSCRTPARGPAAWASPPTMRSGTRTTRAATSAASTQGAVRPANGPRPAVRSRSPMGSPR